MCFFKHKWQYWLVHKKEYVEEKRIYYADSVHSQMHRFYRIHESRTCDRCGRLEYRVRESG